MPNIMNSRASFWMVGITAAAVAAGLMFQLRRPAAVKAAKVQAAQPQAVVTAQGPGTALPPEFFMLPDPGPPIPAPAKKGKPAAQDPAARAALKLVGVDAAAEQIWLEAINNPSLPKLERSDLIEDLNEEGFSKGKQPTRADLPIIEARLKLIDRLMPEAVDETNLDAFGEARKDLINLRAKLAQ
ncbi:MAG: hypothetical protein JWR15_3921 [Prosthecobacter sp.]|nr:hypothetical protein [Prosthecobacter sp.]